MNRVNRYIVRTVKRENLRTSKAISLNARKNLYVKCRTKGSGSLTTSVVETWSYTRMVKLDWVERCKGAENRNFLKHSKRKRALPIGHMRRHGNLKGYRGNYGDVHMQCGIQREGKRRRRKQESRYQPALRAANQKQKDEFSSRDADKEMTRFTYRTNCRYLLVRSSMPRFSVTALLFPRRM